MAVVQEHVLTRHVDGRLMHPFFQKGSTKGDGPAPSTAKSSNSTNDAQILINDFTPSEKARGDATGNSPSSKSDDVAQASPAQNLVTAGKETSQVEASDNVALETDLNLARRKRRKLTPSDSPNATILGHDDNWKHQLKLAADGSEDGVMVQHQDGDRIKKVSPREEADSPRVPSLPRRTPQKPKADPTSNFKPTTAIAAPTCDQKPLTDSQSKPVTPKKKVVKLNANGTLLSSPVRVSPSTKRNRKRKGKDQQAQQTDFKITFKYGRNPEERLRIGQEIEKLLGAARKPLVSGVRVASGPPKSTHPFFLGKAAPKLENKASLGLSESSPKSQESEQETIPRNHKPTPWKDLGFKSNKPIFAKMANAPSSPWPPNDMQHLGSERGEATTPDGPPPVYSVAISKSKQQRTQIPVGEDILQSFASSLLLLASSPDQGIRLPRRIVTGGQQVLETLSSEAEVSALSPGSASSSTSIHPAISRLNCLLPSSFTAFDLGKMDDGESWTSRYAPRTAVDVLQPEASQLRDWLKNLATSAVQKTTPSSGKSSPGKKSKNSSRVSLGRKKRRKIDAELEDFIASSGDECEGTDRVNMKNAVLITGPPGCGKTASVFAVAKELDFEVFEIHPGMRRSAKDIFDKVGDMTQNHLVQGVDGEKSRDLSAGPIESAFVQEEVATGKQGAMNGFVPLKNGNAKLRKVPRDATSSKIIGPGKPTKTQKQSLILLEEVDILFDEDRGFWSGVLTLISQSKRPVILTCNDESSIPSEDIPLHATFKYQPPSSDIVAMYLTALAANEGHILERDLIASLYQAKDHDLRATITELDFWCQMAVGSRKAGLDWLIDGQIEEANPSARVFSKDTYVPGLSLGLTLQNANHNEEQEVILEHAQNVLGLPVEDWQENDSALQSTNLISRPTSNADRLQHLQHVTELFDSRSVLDLFDESLTSALSVRITAALTPDAPRVHGDDVVGAYFTKSVPFKLTRDDIQTAFEPITFEKPTFPPAQGRLAPSFDSPTSIITTDIAPYVRSIVAFDQRLEQQREILAGEMKGKKARTTRAARAALEGGSKKHTRRERWFPDKTDFEMIMRTAGNGWPLVAHNNNDMDTSSLNTPEPAGQIPQDPSSQETGESGSEQ